MSESARLTELEELLHRVQFDHPTQRARLVDAFFAERQARDTARMRARLRGVCLEAMERRTFWALRDGPVCVARAIAYQSMAGLLLRILDDFPDPPRHQETP